MVSRPNYREQSAVASEAARRKYRGALTAMTTDCAIQVLVMTTAPPLDADRPAV
jgi:hypothetical protein